MENRWWKRWEEGSVTGKGYHGWREGEEGKGVVKGITGVHMEKEQGGWQEWERDLRGRCLKWRRRGECCSGADKRG